MAKQKRPNIVAELGRPETAAETAARKAEGSRLYRSRKTVNNLVLSLLVTVGLVAVIYLMVPRGTGDFEQRSVDVAAAAEQAGAPLPLAVPAVPDTWKAKLAVLNNDGALSYWQINYTTENERFASVIQAFTKDGTPVPAKWIAERLEAQKATGTEELGGLSWQVYDHPERRADQVNMRFGLTTEVTSGGVTGTGATGAAAANSSVLVFGTDDASVIRVLAGQVADSLAAQDTQAASGVQPESNGS